MKIKVYAKLSVSEQEVKRILPEAVVSPPVMRDQLLGDIEQRYQVIAIIDGRFDQSLAVSPGEIMDALRSGIRVYGSSSMGALRAAEIEGYGMVGRGQIFEHVRRLGTFRDDFLGQVFAEFLGSVIAEPDPGLKSRSYLDFHFCLEDLVRRKKIARRVSEELRTAYARLHFKHRDLDTLRKALSRSSPPKPALRALDLVLTSGFSQKREDAIALLTGIKADLSRVRALNAKISSAARRAPDPFRFYPKDLRG